MDVNGDVKPQRVADEGDRREGYVDIPDYRGELQYISTIMDDETDVVSAAGFSPDKKKLSTTGATRSGAYYDDHSIIKSTSMCHQNGYLFLAGMMSKLRGGWSCAITE